jgi:hypothetical protein
VTGEIYFQKDYETTASAFSALAGSSDIFVNENENEKEKDFKNENGIRTVMILL